MIQQTTFQIKSQPVVLLWAEPPEPMQLRAARADFGLACDEVDLEQAQAAYLDVEVADASVPQVEAYDFERLYGWFLA